MIASIERRRIRIFIAITYAISIGLGFMIWAQGGLFDSFPNVKPQFQGLLYLLMFAPAAANVISRRVTREGWGHTLLRPHFRGGWPYYIVALLLPAVLTILGGALYYLFFPARFDASMTWALKTVGWRTLTGNATPLQFLLTQTPVTILLSLTTLPLMFGEEFGWRAYLLPKLMPLGARKAVMLVGVIHGAWHWPFVVMGYEYGFGYWGAPVTGPLLWLVITIFLSALMAWLTLCTASVWPAAVAHGVINAAAAIMLYFIRGAPDLLLGPAIVGVIGCLPLAAVAIAILLSRSALAPMAMPPPAHAKSVRVGAHGAA